MSLKITQTNNKNKRVFVCVLMEKVNNLKETQPFFKKYKIVKTIGKGSYGTVKQCVHIYTGKNYAIKFIDKTTIIKPAHIVRIKREITILKLLSHPNIVKVFGAYETSKYLAIVMEYIDGEDLYDLIQRKKVFTEEEARPIFVGLVLGLDYLHQNNIVHRDIKPENVVVSRNTHKPTLIDFGFSTFFHPHGTLSTNCGSPLYASPEIVSSLKYVGPEIDIWSTGILLFALLHGRLPFDDKDTRQLYLKIKLGVFSIDTNMLSYKAVDLLQKIIRVDPVRRIKVKQIFNHPWVVESGLHQEKPRSMPVVFGNHLNQKILRKMQEIPGYEDGLHNQDAIRSDTNSPQRALYTLLFVLDEKKRENEKKGVLKMFKRKNEIFLD